MSKYKVEWAEVKSPEWKVVSLDSGEKDVSINKVSKKGEVFPNFDQIAPGVEIEGELWVSPSGKNYLFPPRVQKQAPNGAYKQKMMEETMQRKETSIRGFQASKEESIKLAGAQRDAVLIVTTIGNTDLTEQQVKDAIIKWRDWFLSDEFNTTLPF